MTHTPGPWVAVSPSVHNHGNLWTIRAEDNHSVAIITHSVGSARRRPSAANARLIAAAPELLAALKALLSPDAEGDVDMAIAAIAKAEGREP